MRAPFTAAPRLHAQPCTKALPVSAAQRRRYSAPQTRDEQPLGLSSQNSLKSGRGSPAPVLRSTLLHTGPRAPPPFQKAPPQPALGPLLQVTHTRPGLWDRRLRPQVLKSPALRWETKPNRHRPPRTCSLPSGPLCPHPLKVGPRYAPDLVPASPDQMPWPHGPPVSAIT